jgi:DNA-3-methyladenine glycosylase
MPLSTDFYLRNNVIEIAKSLIGKVIITKKDGYLTSGIITETEAYNGIKDKASHAYGGKKNKKKSSYVYERWTCLCLLMLWYTSFI